MEDQLQRWRRHFESVLNRPVPSQLADSRPADAPLNINTEPISRGEIRTTLTQLKNANSTCYDLTFLSHPGNHPRCFLHSWTKASEGNSVTIKFWIFWKLAVSYLFTLQRSLHFILRSATKFQTLKPRNMYKNVIRNLPLFSILYLMPLALFAVYMMHLNQRKLSLMKMLSLCQSRHYAFLAQLIISCQY